MENLIAAITVLSILVAVLVMFLFYYVPAYRKRKQQSIDFYANWKKSEEYANKLSIDLSERINNYHHVFEDRASLATRLNDCERGQDEYKKQLEIKQVTIDGHEDKISFLENRNVGLTRELRSYKRKFGAIKPAKNKPAPKK